MRWWLGIGRRRKFRFFLGFGLMGFVFRQWINLVKDAWLMEDIVSCRESSAR